MGRAHRQTFGRACHGHTVPSAGVLRAMRYSVTYEPTHGDLPNAVWPVPDHVSRIALVPIDCENSTAPEYGVAGSDVVPTTSIGAATVNVVAGTAWWVTGQ